MEIVEHLQINDRSPSDRFVRFADGNIGYIRYRWGLLSCEVTAVSAQTELTDPALLSLNGVECYSEQIGNALDGSITLQDACKAMGFELNLSVTRA